MAENAELRSYKKIGSILKQELIDGLYRIGDRLPPERDLAEKMNVSRTVVREAIIMLELENLVEVRKGSGVYVINMPLTSAENQDESYEDVGPFELLQARQLLESGIAEFAAIQATRNDILRLKEILNKERMKLAEDDKDYTADEEFHSAIAEITQNEILIKLQKDLWKYRTKSSMWQGLHAHISDREYRKSWLQDHQNILNGIQRKNPALAKKAMWQHLENVKQKLFELSDIEDPDFDGFLFSVNPVVVGL
ncbi:FCD domain-containing protein [Bisgaard Taxon 10/6]|uniref:FCD domain-containing protein n=1 Tax=Exercitatus varius TaxID=67857 RepID=A0AAW6QAS4_9PAST|nr:FCD domain-containing protein [Exercitatus varius]MDG2948691.1 FCD domain-containing protein [Exercitatus varius]MDG2950694.1 FCD domain-containing protein [Exercitatus varius]MDG2961196.1 FCD domain-containing protein [Exercitatus varius]QOF67702.1 FCD domain-containing protein [Actinobacillus sp. GY-402]